MVRPAVAQETICALRREIAKIEGTLPERLSTNQEDGTVLLRRHGIPNEALRFFKTGASRLDAALGGGLPCAALTEIHGQETRDAGAVSGFALALAALGRIHVAEGSPILWIGTSEMFREAGLPYAPGLFSRFSIPSEALLFVEAGNLENALWIAEEAASLRALSAVILEVRGNPKKLDLTASRRLHLRAQGAGHPVYLIRQSAAPEPTAAPVRLVVSPAPAGPRTMLSGPLAGSIGPPAFSVTISKSRTGMPAQFILEWKSDESAFVERRSSGRAAANPGLVVPAPSGGADFPPAPGSILAFAGSEAAASGHQPSREQRPAHRRT